MPLAICLQNPSNFEGISAVEKSSSTTLYSQMMNNMQSLCCVIHIIMYVAECACVSTYI